MQAKNLPTPACLATASMVRSGQTALGAKRKQHRGWRHGSPLPHWEDGHGVKKRHLYQPRNKITRTGSKINCSEDRLGVGQLTAASTCAERHFPLVDRKRASFTPLESFCFPTKQPRPRSDPPFSRFLPTAQYAAQRKTWRRRSRPWTLQTMSSRSWTGSSGAHRKG